MGEDWKVPIPGVHETFSCVGNTVCSNERYGSVGSKVWWRGRVKDRWTDERIAVRQTERQTDTDRPTDRHTYRETHTHTHRHRQTHTQTRTHTDRHTHTHRHNRTHTDRHRHRHRHRQTYVAPWKAEGNPHSPPCAVLDKLELFPFILMAHYHTSESVIFNYIFIIYYIFHWIIIIWLGHTPNTQTEIECDRESEVEKDKKIIRWK